MTTDPNGQGSARPGYHHGDLRRTLIRIAREQIAESGAAALSLAALARRAGVSQPAPYRHFADRNALLEAVTTEGFESFTAALTAAAQATKPGDALRAMALAYVGFGEANIELYRLMFASRLVPEADPASPLKIAARTAFSRLRDALSVMTPPGQVDDKAMKIWAQLHGLVMLKADGHISRPLAEWVEVPELHQPSA